MGGTDYEVMHFRYNNSRVYFEEGVSIGYSSDSDDDYAYFDQNDEYMMWDNSESMFTFSDDVYSTRDLRAAQQVSAASLSAWRIETVQGPSSGSDNQTHQVECSDGYAITGMSIWASDRLDGYITLVCQYLGDMLDTGSYSWTSGSGTGDDTWHSATCGSGEIATGFSVYASSRLDNQVKLKCTDVASG